MYCDKNSNCDITQIFTKDQFLQNTNCDKTQIMTKHIKGTLINVRFLSTTSKIVIKAQNTFSSAYSKN